jgi:uncharacterized protein
LDELLERAHSEVMIELMAYGLVAGVLTTLTGQGGGLFLLLVLSFRLGPHAALALSSPALLLGNLHRVITLRTSIDRSLAWRFSLGALPGALLGGYFAGAMPSVVLRVLLVAVTVLTLAKAFGLLRFAVAPAAYPWAGFTVGGLTGTSGGAGVLLAPVLLASGLSGARYLATQSVIAVAMHVGRIVAYGHGGLFQETRALDVALLSLAIFAGNALADRLKRGISPRTISRTEYTTLVVCTLLAVTGIGR